MKAPVLVALTLLPLGLIAPPKCPVAGQPCYLAISANGTWQTLPIPPVIAQSAPMQRAIVLLEPQLDGSWTTPANAPVPKSALSITVNGLRYFGVDDYSVINPNRIQPVTKWVWEDGTPFKVVADYWY